jgi:hypothetical protein
MSMISLMRRPGAGLAKLVLAAGLAAGLASLPVRATEPPRALEPPRRAQAPEPLCFCWSDGRKIAEGATACIRTSHGRRLAACGRVINMMSWEVSDTPCPES